VQHHGDAMTENNSTHIVDQIEAYLSGGLSPDERLAFDAHIAQCPSCATALAEAREADANLRQLFNDARPRPGFEDQIVRNLRLARAPRRRLLHPIVLRTAAGIAAAVVLAGAGVTVSNALDRAASPLLLADSSIHGQADSRDEPSAMRRSLSVAGKPPASPTWGYALGGEAAQDQGVAATALPLGYKAAETKGAKDGRSSGLNGVYYRQLAESGKQADQKAALSTEGKKAFDDILRFPESPSGGSGGGAKTADNVAFRPGDKLGNNGKFDHFGSVLDGDRPGGVMGPQGTSSPALARVSTTGVVGSLGVETPAKSEPAAAAAHEPAPPPQEAPPKAAPPVPATDNAPPPDLGRKIIRDGTMEFEVTDFEDALTRITKLVTEQGGFVGTTDSDKLPNGKVKGTITVRVPPQHLDTLILTLHGIGDLKSQKITAEDVTKHYTDLQSQLRAAQAMYDRLIDIIKTGKGQIKDLVEAEKQLGVWEEKIEQLKGEQRYLENLVSLSTLTISLYEKDIKTPASANETEQVQMSLETEKVDDAYNKAIEAIKAAKGRISQSELKQYDAGQLGATISAAIPPDAAEQVIARLRQLDGRIAHFSRDRQQTTQNGEALPAGVMNVKRQDLVLSMQIYNLANVAPRRTTTVQLAATDVEHTYQQVIDQVRGAGGRIVSSSLAKPDANTQAADLEFQAPSEKSDTLLSAIRGYGDVMRQDTTENPDTANVTEAKRGVHLRIVSLTAVPPRQTQTLKVAAANVDRTYQQVIEQVRAAGGRVITSSLTKPDVNTETADLQFELPSPKADASLNIVRGYGEVMQQDTAQSADITNSTESKRGVHLVILSLAAVAPRETQTVQLAASNVPQAFNDILAAVKAADGRVLQSDLSAQNPQDVSGTIAFQVSRAAFGTLNAEIAKAAEVLTRTINRSADTQNTVDSKLLLTLSLRSAENLPPRQTTTVREEVSDVERAVDDLVNAATTAGGRRVGGGALNQDRAGHVTGEVVVDVPLARAGPILDQLERMGYRRSKQIAYDNAVTDGPLARARIDATFSNSSASLGGEESTWDAIRHGLGTSGRGLRMSLQYLIVGLCFLAPWILLLWILWRLVRRSRSRVIVPAA
jgi:hypothetical protein